MGAALHALVIAGVFLYKASWSILFGVLVTAVIDVLVDQNRIARLLGGRDIRSLGMATAAGAASSACTFGAVSIATALFRKGASVENTFAFALASTNIVFELGILIYVLLGWQYLVAELISGFVLVAIMYGLVRLTLPSRVFTASRRRMQEEDSEDDGDVRFPVVTPGTMSQGPVLQHQGVVYAFPSEDCRDAFVRHVVKRPSLWEQVHGWGLWVRIARRYFKTLGRIGKSVLIGFTISGFIVEFVPPSFWHAIFLPATGFFGILENAVAGVLAGVFSFIGSIGIVPFAGALGATGVAFAGVIGCILSDLITVPVMSVWRNFYGSKAALYIFGLFFTTMVATGVLIDYLFQALHWMPGPISAMQIAAVPVGFNLTIVMTVLMVGVAVALYLADRAGAFRGADPVQDPLCGMTFERRAAAVQVGAGPNRRYFCSRTCAELAKTGSGNEFLKGKTSARGSKRVAGFRECKG